MTVRWKPLLILSGVFLVIAVVGLMAIAMVLRPQGPAQIVERARTFRKAGNFEGAKVDYDRALQANDRDADLHEEISAFYGEWAEKAPADKAPTYRLQAYHSLAKAASLDAKRLAPRKTLLTEALKQEDMVEANRWAKEILTLDATNLDAHYAQATEAIEAASLNVPEVRRHLKALQAQAPMPARSIWLIARLSELTRDETKLKETLAQARPMPLPAESNTVDRMALLKLRAMDVKAAASPAEMKPRVEALTRDALAVSAETGIAASRLARISLLIEQTQRNLTALSTPGNPDADGYKSITESVEKVTEELFKKALDVPGGADLGVYLAYADHLRYRNKRQECLDVVDRGVKAGLAAKKAGNEVVLALHALAIECTLGDLADVDRFAKAEPHIKVLLDSSVVRFQALGHLFQGAVDLERSGLLATAGAKGENEEAERAARQKARSSALYHLKTAASQLPDLAEAQARYGVALILSQEPALGRQYLAQARRMGTLDPQYQVWAAWSMVQAGYPEEAEPIVQQLLAEVDQGRRPRALAGTLYLLSGEIYQARKTQPDLRKAIDYYRKAFESGQTVTPALRLRMAQLEIMLGQPENALKRVNEMQGKGEGVPGAEYLAILIMLDKNQKAEAQARLDKARAEHPKSGELASLAANLALRDKDPAKADKILEDFLKANPDSISNAIQRASILATDLKKPAEARAVLLAAAERSENSTPLVQLGTLQIQEKDFDAAAATVAQIRSRWKEAAAADMLEAQLALARNDPATASVHFAEVLKKDPNNKVVQFYKAQLDGRDDPGAAARVFEALSKDHTSKEIEDGIPLMTAAQSALANLEMTQGDIDSAIGRYESLLKAGQSGGITRGVKWALVAAHVQKKEWPAAKAEIESLINDPKAKPTARERVRAATYYRFHNEQPAALQQVELALKDEPNLPGAIVTKAQVLVKMGKNPEAIATIRKALEVPAARDDKARAGLFLMLAAIEAEDTTPQGKARAAKVLDEGMAACPDSVEMVQAKYALVSQTDKKAALAFVEEKAAAINTTPFNRMLATIYRDRGDYAGAEKVLNQLRKANPKEASSLGAAEIRMVAAQAIDAGAKGDTALEAKLNDRTAALIREMRTAAPKEPTFLQLDCELAARKRDYTRALALCGEYEELAKLSPVGPILRAQIYVSQNRPKEAADSYAEALKRNPRQPEVRLQLARLNLQIGKVDDALQQTSLLSDADKKSPSAVLVNARALASRTGTPAQVAESREAAIKQLVEAVKENPDFIDAYYLAAEIQLASGQRAAAIATLKAAVGRRPDDTAALSLLIQVMTEPREKGQAPTTAELADAQSFAKAIADADASGRRSQAISLGFHKANQLELGLPYAEKAVTKLDDPIAHLGLGDILLGLGEGTTDKAAARQYLDRALAEYDKALMLEPRLVEAANNKAWILHQHFQKNREALEVAQALMGKVDPNTLPGEFFDTLGAIQEAEGRPKDAEESYRKGLRKAADHPVLNFHMARLILTNDRSQAARAADYLNKARAGRDRLPATMVAEMDTLIQTMKR